MKIAIASSGLGHVARGIEAWALNAATAVAETERIEHGAWRMAQNERQYEGIGTTERRNGTKKNNAGFFHPETLSVTLFAGAAIPGFPPEAGKSQVPNFKLIVLPCLRRSSPWARRLARFMPGFTWRWGWKSDYGWEQFSFWLKLWPILRRGRFDILHVQDPMLACWCMKFRKLGILKTKEILAHGTEESAEFINQFDYVQHLAPWHMGRTQSAERGTGSAEDGICRRQAEETRISTAIPNFVDTEHFRPVKDKDDRTKHRARFGIPENAFVIGTVAAVKKHHKRVDCLIREFAQYRDVSISRHLPVTPFLLIAGARCDDSEELAAMAEKVAPGCVKFLFNLPHDGMPECFRCMDLFILTSLFEMMPIALIEAMASGLPCIVNRHPVLEWIVGTGPGIRSQGSGIRGQESGIRGQESGLSSGICIDMGREGELAERLMDLTREWVEEKRTAARERAVEMFSKGAIVPQMIELYSEVLKNG